MKKQVEFFDTDFLDNKIEIGDKVIFEAPGYREFVIGTVITKAPKSCQIEYINDWNYHRDDNVIEVVRQGYGQLIKYPIKEAEWITTGEELKNTVCSNCGNWVETPYGKTSYCSNCGAKMKGVGKE